MDVERTVRKKGKYHETSFQEEHIVYPRTTTEITYVSTLHNMLHWQHIVYAGYTKCSSGAYCVCRVHNMLLKGAYCVGEHFVDPQSTDQKIKSNVTVISQMRLNILSNLRFQSTIR